MLVYTSPVLGLICPYPWQTIVRPPGPNHWDAFLRNAKRVRVLHLRDSGGLTQRAFHILSLQRPVLHLFPNLKHLSIQHSWNPTSKNDVIPYGNLLVGPSLEGIDIASGSDLVILSVLEKVQHTTDRIRRILISSPSNSTHSAAKLEIHAALAGVVAGSSKYLKELSISTHTIDAHVFSRLLASPSFHDLSFHIGRNNGDLVSAAIESSIESSPFTSLKHLTLNHIDLHASPTISLVKALGKRLLSLDITCIQRPSLTCLATLFEAVASHHRLSDFTIDMSYFARRIDSTEMVGIGTLRPLLKLPLVVLGVGVLPVRLSSGDILEVARSLPEISVLTLQPNGRLPLAPVKPAKLEELTHFAEYCSDMKVLEVWVDARRVTIDETRPGKGRVAGLLDSFNPGCSPISDPEIVAAFLSDIFPNLQPSIDDDDLDTKWEIVQRLVGAFTKVRNQERRSRNITN